MNDEQIKNFFGEHKKSIEDGGFEARLMETVKYLPKPKRAGSFTLRDTIVALSAMTGVLLFVLFGGADALVSGIFTTLSAVTLKQLLSPEIIATSLFLFVLLFGIGRAAYSD